MVNDLSNTQNEFDWIVCIYVCFMFIINSILSNTVLRFVANLWDVTDKDIDRFSKALFRKWGITLDNNERDNGSHISLVASSE